MIKSENMFYSYEVKFSMNSTNLDLINSFIGEFLQRFNKLDVTNFSVSIVKIKDAGRQVFVELPAGVQEEVEKKPRKRAREERPRSKETLEEMEKFIKNTMAERKSISRKDLVDLAKEEYKDRYKETTIIQKVDLIIRQLIENGVIQRKARGIFELVELSESQVQ